MIYRVTDILKVNIVAVPVTGGRGIKPKRDIFVPATHDAAPATASGIPYRSAPPPGQVVTVEGPGWRRPPGEFYVVL